MNRGMRGWVEEAEEKPEGRRDGGLWLEAKGAWVFAPWSLVFGVVEESRFGSRRVLVLLPRKAPNPPWVEVREGNLPEGFTSLDELVSAVEERSARQSYRSTANTEPAMGPEELFEAILQRQEVPGAMEIPVGAGPGGIAERFLEMATGGVVGGIAGLITGGILFTSIAGPIAGVGAAAGAIAPTFFSKRWAGSRHKRQPARVLVLAPDGCVVGLPSGPAAFSWNQVSGFAVARSARGRQQLELNSSTGELLGAIDSAWFGAPLPRIVAIAEAYRSRVVG